MPNAKYLEPKKGMTSLQAAAMYLSDGKTDDAEEVNQTLQAETFNMDALQRAHLSKLMGFRFSVDVKYKKITVSSNDAPLLSKSAAFSGVMDQEAVNTVVELCGKLKEAWDKEKAKSQEKLLDFASDPKNIKEAAKRSMGKRQSAIEKENTNV